MESQENQYRWTKAEAVYPDRPGRSYALKRLRYRLRFFCIKDRLFILSNLSISILFLSHY